jgi:hypothetical protein
MRDKELTVKDLAVASKWNVNVKLVVLVHGEGRNDYSHEAVADVELDVPLASYAATDLNATLKALVSQSLDKRREKMQEAEDDAKTLAENGETA